MRDEDKEDNLLDLLITGGFGYLMGASKYKNWEPFINEFNKRLSHISYLQIIIPSNLFEKSGDMKQVYSEAIHAYLCGIPNASLPLLLKCLEVGLRIKYREVEEKESDMNLFGLIEWSEKLLKERKEIAHGFRILRNLIHEEKVVNERDIPEAIRHTSIILNDLFPLPSNVAINVFCNSCNQWHQYPILTTNNFIGNNVLFACNKSRQNINAVIMP